MTVTADQTVDEILTAYEARWRQLSLDQVPQFYGAAAGGVPDFIFAAGATCAFIARIVEDRDLQVAARSVIGRWTCPEADCAWVAGGLSGAIIHLNNAHHMDWLWFATKFRETWTQGLAR